MCQVLFLTLVILFFTPTFSVQILKTHLKAFLDFDCPNFGGTGNIRMSSFQIILVFENWMVGLKVMASRRELICLAQFSRYYNRFNSDFDP